MYCLHRISKSNGFRLIEEPDPKLKQLQRNLIKQINVKFPDNINGIKATSIISNSIEHINKAKVFKLDIKDFYQSIRLDRVICALLKYTDIDDSEEELEELCIFNGHLPTGAPASPILANLVFLDIDTEILNLIGDTTISYTRYMDDLTFSTNEESELDYLFRKQLIGIVNNAGFKINKKKTCIKYVGEQHKVTGVIVNKKLNIDRKYRLLLRSRLDHYARENKPLDDKINGELSHLHNIDPNLKIKFNAYYNKRLLKYNSNRV